MKNENQRKKITFYRHILFGIFFAVMFSAAFQSAVKTLFHIYLNGPVTSVNIQNGDSVINISLKYGDDYTSETSFNKAEISRHKNSGVPHEKSSKGTIMVSSGISGLIKIIIFIWFIIRLKPIYNFAVKNNDAFRPLAIKRFNNIYKTIGLYFIIIYLLSILNDLLFLYKTNNFSLFNFLTFYVIPAISGCYYGIYFSVIYLEPFLFTKIAELFYSGDEIYSKKEGFQLNLRSRLFMTITNLLVIPMIIIIFYAHAIPDISIEKLNALTDINEMKKIVYPILTSKYNLFAIAFVSLCYAIGYIEMLYRGIQRPIDELVKKMERLANGDFNVKTSVLSSDEIGRLKYNFNLMIDGLTDREKLRETFGRYVSIEIAKHLIETNKINLGGEDISATILFSDIRNFTSMSEKMSAREVVDFLNEYFSYISEPIIKNRGVINKFIGDVMAIYTPHLGSENHVEDAVNSAIGMRKKLEEFNAAKKYNFIINFGIGIHTGNLVAGNIGTKSRLEYTVIGDTVNIASRIESENKTFKTDILISESVFDNISENLKDKIKLEKCPLTNIKGKEKPVLLYKIL